MGLGRSRHRGRPDRAVGWRAADELRGFATAVRLGWRVEANWADPALFAIYSVAKPLAGVLILVVMVDVVSGGASADVRAFVVIGSSLWAFVQNGVAGLGMSVLDDRERYRMLRYLAVSPPDLGTILVGRGVARLGVGLSGALVTLVAGVAVLGVPFEPTRVAWPATVAAFALGLAGIVGIGIVMAAICLQTRQEAWYYPEAVAGALFLVSGAVFPLRVLPAPLQAAGLATPVTWWIEGVRRGLFPDAASAVGGPGSLFAGLTGALAPDVATTLLALSATGAIGTLAAIGAFRLSERRAKDLGLYDQTTGS